MMHIFVYDSDQNGRAVTPGEHYAHRFARACNGIGEGLNGSAYAIPTMRSHLGATAPLSISEIAQSVARFQLFASMHRDSLVFMVDHVGEAQHGIDVMADMFRHSEPNVFLPQVWRNQLGDKERALSIFIPMSADPKQLTQECGQDGQRCWFSLCRQVFQTLITWRRTYPSFSINLVDDQMQLTRKIMAWAHANDVHVKSIPLNLEVYRKHAWEHAQKWLLWTGTDLLLLNDGNLAFGRMGKEATGHGLEVFDIAIRLPTPRLFTDHAPRHATATVRDADAGVPRAGQPDPFDSWQSGATFEL